MSAVNTLINPLFQSQSPNFYCILFCCSALYFPLQLSHLFYFKSMTRLLFYTLHPEMWGDLTIGSLTATLTSHPQKGYPGICCVTYQSTFISNKRKLSK